MSSFPDLPGRSCPVSGQTFLHQPALCTGSSPSSRSVQRMVEALSSFPLLTRSLQGVSSSAFPVSVHLMLRLESRCPKGAPQEGSASGGSQWAGRSAPGARGGLASRPRFPSHSMATALGLQGAAGREGPPRCGVVSPEWDPGPMTQGQPQLQAHMVQSVDGGRAAPGADSWAQNWL